MSLALAASDNFEETFNRRTANIVIVPGGSITAKQNAAFKAAGYPTSLPWVSAKDKAKLREASIRRQVMEQTKTFPEAVQKQALQQALSSVGSTSEGDGFQEGAFAHELGHLWFIQAFKPDNSETQKGHAYGGWAPDWLDETAAVLLENPAHNKRRRESFGKLSFDETIPLKEFFAMEHPGAKAAQMLRNNLPTEAMEGPSRESRTIVLTGKEAEEFVKNSGGDKVANFYAQAQVFSDFLLSRAKDRAIYPEITEHLLAGGTFETWLETKGTAWNLPSSIDALGLAWRDWIEN